MSSSAGADADADRETGSDYNPFSDSESDDEVNASSRGGGDVTVDINSGINSDLVAANDGELRAPLLADRDEVLASGEDEGFYAGDADRDPGPKRSRKCRRCALALCLVLFAVLLAATAFAVKALAVYRKCNTPQGCVQLRWVQLADLCGIPDKNTFQGITKVGEFDKDLISQGNQKYQSYVRKSPKDNKNADTKIGFDIDAELDLPSGSWFRVFVDKVVVRVEHNGTELFTTDAMTPVFTRQDGHAEPRWMHLGGSTMQVQNAMLNVPEENGQGTERVAAVAWRILNQMDTDFDIYAEATVGFNFFSVPIRKRLSHSLVYHYSSKEEVVRPMNQTGQNNEARIPTVSTRGITSNQLDNKIEDNYDGPSPTPNFVVNLAKVHFHPVLDPKNSLNASVAVRVDINEKLPALRTVLPRMDNIEIYASNSSVVPTKDNVFNNTAIQLVATAVLENCQTARSFIIPTTVNTTTEAASLPAMQAAASRYVVAEGGESTFFYMKASPSNASLCFIDRVLKAMDPIRYELLPMSANEKPAHERSLDHGTLVENTKYSGSRHSEELVSLVAGTEGPGTPVHSSTLKTIQIEYIDSTAEEGRIKLTAFSSANITGQLPEVILDVAARGERSTEIRVPPATIVNPMAGVATEVTLQQPALLWDQLRTADYDPSTLELQLIGSARDDVSLLTAILKTVSYSLTKKKEKEHLVLSGPTNLFETYLRSSPTNVSAGIYLQATSLASSFPFNIQWSPQCVGGQPVKIINALHHIRMELGIPVMQFGPDSRNEARIDFLWHDSTAGAGFGDLVRDIRAHVNTSISFEKSDCVNVTVFALHRLFSSHVSAKDDSDVLRDTKSSSSKGHHHHKDHEDGNDPDDDSSWDIGIRFHELQSVGAEGALVDFGCISAGTPCDPGGAGLRARIDPLEFAIKLPNTQVKVLEFAPLRLLPVPGATVEIAAPKITSFRKDGVHLNSSLTFETVTSNAMREMVQVKDLASSMRGDSSLNLLSAAVGQIIAAMLDKPPENQTASHSQNDDWVFAEDVFLDVFSGPDHVRVHLDCSAVPGKPGKATVNIPELKVQLGDLGTLSMSAWEASNLGLNTNFQLDYEIDTKTAPAVTKLIGALVNKQSSTIVVQSADKAISVALNLTAVSTSDRAPSQYALQVLGGRNAKNEPIMNLNVPCIIPNLCPKKPKDLNGEPYTLAYDLLGSLYVGSQAFRRLHLRAPPIEFALDAGVENRMIDFSIPTIDLQMDTKQTDKISVEIGVVVRDVQLVRNSIQTLMDSVIPVKYRLFVPQKHGQGMLPSLLRDADVSFLFDAQSPDGRPVPMAKEQQWWFPLASTGAWKLIYTTANTATFEVNMLLHNPTPITAHFPDMFCEVSYLIGGPEATIPREALYIGHGYVNAGSLILPGNASTHILSTLVADQKTSEIPESCTEASKADPTTKHNCVFSTLLEKMIGKTETHILIAAGFTNPHGDRVNIQFEGVFLEGELGKAVRPYVPPPRFAKDLPTDANSSAIDEFAGVFRTVNVDGWSTAWDSLISLGVNLEVEAVLHNPFAFPIWVGSYQLNLTFDDPTGEYVSYLPSTYPPALKIPLVTNLAAPDLDMVIPSNTTMTTPEVSVRLLKNKTELACRLYNAAEKVQELCASVPEGLFKVGVGTFIWTQRLNIYNVTAVGNNACLYQPACTPKFLPAVNLESTKWSLVGSSTMPKPGVIMLTKGETSELAGAWYGEKLHISDGFDVSFDFNFKDTSTVGGGDGIAFVVQRDGGPKALGVRCYSTPCNAYKGITGPSFGVVLYRSTFKYVEMHVLVNGVTSPEVGFASSPLLSSVVDGKSHNLRIYYSRADRKIYVYLDNSWQLSSSVWEPEHVDQGRCSAGNAAPEKSSCIDMDAIAGSTGSAWVGFTASTGIAMSSMQEVENITFRNVLASMEKSVIVEEGLVVAKMKHAASLTVDLRDSCGAPIRRALSVTPEIFLQKPPEGRFAPYEVTPQPDGLIKVVFTAQSPGEYILLARYGNDESMKFHKLGTFLIADGY